MIYMLFFKYYTFIHLNACLAVHYTMLLLCKYECKMLVRDNVPQSDSIFTFLTKIPILSFSKLLSSGSLTHLWLGSMLCYYLLNLLRAYLLSIHCHFKGIPHFMVSICTHGPIGPGYSNVDNTLYNMRGCNDYNSYGTILSEAWV